MSISAHEVTFDEDMMWLALEDGRTLGVPLAWFPRLLNASAEERRAVEITAFGLHWEGIDEDISVPALLGERPLVAAE